MQFEEKAFMLLQGRKTYTKSFESICECSAFTSLVLPSIKPIATNINSIRKSGINSKKTAGVARQFLLYGICQIRNQIFIATSHAVQITSLRAPHLTHVPHLWRCLFLIEANWSLGTNPSPLTTQSHSSFHSSPVSKFLIMQ